MKKKYGVLAAVILLFICVLGFFYQNYKSGKKEGNKAVRIGVTLYRGDDSFINTIRGKLEDQAKEYEKNTGIKVVMEIVDAKGNQNTQNSQVDRFISLGYDAICVNMVDRSAASNIIGKAMDADTPVVFFNREPVEEDMRRWEKLYYVGENAKESATLQGNMLVEAYKSDPTSLDINGDGKVSYVLFGRREQPSGFSDQNRVVDSDTKGWRGTFRKDYGRHSKLGQKSGFCLDGAVADPVSGRN